MHKDSKNSVLNSAFSNQPTAVSLIDTHCHLEMDDFDPDREEVIKRAKDAGIEAIITISSDLESNIKVIKLSQKYDFIYSSIGIHPHDAKDFSEEVFEKIKEWAKEYKIKESGVRSQNTTPPCPPLAKGVIRGGKVVAIGETGLDYHYDYSPRDVQREVFLKQLRYAKEINLPAIIHSREAKKDTLNIIEESGVTKGVFHCFSGDIDMAEKAISMGFFISIAGPVTFKNARRLREVVKIIPDEYLLIETDAPYLTPEPFRGKRNEPSYLIYNATATAKIRDISFEDITRITTLNAKRLFGIGTIAEKGEIAYKIRDRLYLNITNECTNRCSFCIRFHTDYVKGHNLRLSVEPTEEDLKKAITTPSRYKEIVFCGYGEPLLRLDLVKEVASWIKQNDGKVRINTNGHGNLIHGRNILPELKGIVDSISISLDAQDEETYTKICRPVFKNAFREVLSFIKEAKKYIPDVTVTVVTATSVDVEKCREIAEELGVRFRVRKLDLVG